MRVKPRLSDIAHNLLQPTYQLPLVRRHRQPVEHRLLVTVNLTVFVSVANGKFQLRKKS